MNSVYLPMFAQIGLTLSILPMVAFSRIKEISGNSELAKATAVDVSAFSASSRKIANNFNSQFQLPVLFYVGCIFAVITGANSPYVTGFAWAFVAMRIIHTIIHTTYNSVPQRFVAFLCGLLALVSFLIAVFSHAASTPIFLGQ